MHTLSFAWMIVLGKKKRFACGSSAEEVWVPYFEYKIMYVHPHPPPPSLPFLFTLISLI